MHLSLSNLNIRGIIHIGAHECEELDHYQQVVPNSRIIWIEANPIKVQEMKEKNPSLNIFSGLISHIDNHLIPFYLTNNTSSSSCVPLQDHLTLYPDVTVQKTLMLLTKTLNTFVYDEAIAISDFNFLTLITQGSEYNILKGAQTILPHIDYIYTKFYTCEVYEGAPTLEMLTQLLQSFKPVEVNLIEPSWGYVLFFKGI